MRRATTWGEKTVTWKKGRSPLGRSEAEVGKKMGGEKKQEGIDNIY